MRSLNSIEATDLRDSQIQGKKMRRLEKKRRCYFTRRDSNRFVRGDNTMASGRADQWGWRCHAKRGNQWVREENWGSEKKIHNPEDSRAREKREPREESHQLSTMYWSDPGRGDCGAKVNLSLSHEKERDEEENRCLTITIGTLWWGQRQCGPKSTLWRKGIWFARNQTENQIYQLDAQHLITWLWFHMKCSQAQTRSKVLPTQHESKNTH